VSQRTRELGIRVGLGARRSDISRAVLNGSVASIALGVAVGIGGAIGAGRFLSSLLFGAPPYDALILTVAAAALFTAGFLANWLPARRAASIPWWRVAPTERRAAAAALGAERRTGGRVRSRAVTIQPAVRRVHVRSRAGDVPSRVACEPSASGSRLLLGHPRSEC
jgi:FtsX-like permease family protein